MSCTAAWVVLFHMLFCCTSCYDKFVVQLHEFHCCTRSTSYTRCLLSSRISEIEPKYYADGEDAYAMKRDLVVWSKQQVRPE